MSSTSVWTYMVFDYWFSPQHWSNISTSIGHSVEWPRERSHHAATHLSGPSFVIVGGLDDESYTLNDMWLSDTTTKLWKKVSFSCTVSFHNFVCVQEHTNDQYLHIDKYYLGS